MTHIDSSKPNLRGPMAVVGGALIVALVLYVTAYASLVTVDDGPSAPDFVMGEAAADYRFGGRGANVIFAPLHAVDRRLRENTWTFEPPLIQPEPPP